MCRLKKMRMKNMFLLWIMCVAFIAAGLSFQTISYPQETKALPSVVKIGFLYPKTGDLAAIGQGLLDGALAAAYRANQTYDFDVQLVLGDSASGSKDTAQASAQSILDEGVKVIVGAAASASTLAVQEKTVPAKVPLISYASTSPSITDLDDNGYVFRVVASDAFQGQALAQLVLDKGVKKVVVVNRDDAYGNGIADQFKKSFTEKGGTVLDHLTYATDANSFQTEISTIKSKNPEGVVLIAFVSDGTQFFSEAKAENINVKWFGADGIADEALTNSSAIKDYLNGNLFGTAPAAGSDAPSGTTTKYDQYESDLQQVGGSKGIFGDYAYDAVLLAAAAIDKAGKYDGTAIRDAIYQLGKEGFVGATGTKSFDCAGDPISQLYKLWKAQDGAVVTEKVINFEGTTSAATGPCSAAGTPGFELWMALPLLGLLSIPIVVKKRRK